MRRTHLAIAQNAMPDNETFTQGIRDARSTRGRSLTPIRIAHRKKRDRQREEAARELEELKQAWSRAYQAQGIDPKTVHYAKVFLDDDPN